MEDKAGNLKRRPRGNGNDTTLFSRLKVGRLIVFSRGKLIEKY